MKTAAALLLASTGMAYPSIALAQDESSETTVSEEIVVTAQKREQRLIEVPAAITVLGGEELEQRAIESAQDLAFAVPGMALREDGPGSYQIFMRGLSNQYGGGALVSVYMDEAPVTLTGFDQLPVPVLDLERIEVLKGPQGTLYGQGSVAGVVRYITSSPDLTGFSGSVQGQLTTVEGGEIGKQLEAVVNVPIVDGVFGVRVAGMIERDGGWQDQPEAGIRNGNDRDIEHVRIKALWNVTNALRAEATVAIHNAEYPLGQGYEEPDRTVDVAIDRSRQLMPKDFEYQLYNLNLTYDLGFAQILSATTYINHDHDYPFSYVGGPETIYQGMLEGTDARFLDADQFTQEIRVSSSGGGPLQWTVGGYYNDVERNLFVNDIDTLFGGALFPDAIFESDLRSKSYSVFADVSFEITDRLTVGAGARYFRDHQVSVSDDGDETFDKFDPRLYASYAVTDNVNVYASFARGFRSGGFNSGALPAFGPEELTNYEIGAKGAMPGGYVQFEIAAFYSEYRDMLRRGLVFLPETSRFASLTSNIGQAEIKGLELGLTVRPLPSLTLNTTASYIDAEITEVNATDATNIAGDLIDYVPELAFTLGAMYEFVVSNDADGFARVDYSFRDRVPYTDRTSFPAQFVPQYSDTIGLLDARIGVDWDGKRVEVFGTNLANQNKYIDPYHQWNNANRTRPRTFGVRFGVDFF